MVCTINMVWFCLVCLVCFGLFGLFPICLVCFNLFVLQRYVSTKGGKISFESC
jgi:hypothetical protein